jgi:hypothetical protein
VAADERRPRSMPMPRAALVRAVMLNHQYNHRRQLTTVGSR